MELAIGHHRWAVALGIFVQLVWAVCCGDGSHHYDGIFALATRWALLILTGEARCRFGVAEHVRCNNDGILGITLLILNGEAHCRFGVAEHVRCNYDGILGITFIGMWTRESGVCILLMRWQPLPWHWGMRSAERYWTQRHCAGDRLPTSPEAVPFRHNAR